MEIHVFHWMATNIPKEIERTHLQNSDILVITFLKQVKAILWKTNPVFGNAVIIYNLCMCVIM